MKKIFSANQIKELDAYTIQNEPIAPVDLVERAAVAFVHEFCRIYSKQYTVYVFAGKGNNGADALAIARLLKDESYRVVTYLINPLDNLSAECAINRRRLCSICSEDEFIEVIDRFQCPNLSSNTVVIDGLFGTGLSKPLTGGYAMLVDSINQSDAEVVSIDIPSGLFCDDNSENDSEYIVKATRTFTFCSPKLSFLFSENEQYIGEWKVLDILLHPDAIDTIQVDRFFLEEEDIVEAIHSRSRYSHKGTFGHAILFAGSKGKLGAALLAAKACLRSGAGLLTAHLPKRAEYVFQTAFPECMIDFDNQEDFFTSVPDLSKYTAIGVGPGLGLALETGEALERLLQTAKAPMVIDADGLNLLAANKDLLKKLPQRTILTPHPKEFDRLAGDSKSGYERLQKAKQFAMDYKVCVVLKGAFTAICMPSGSIFFNSNGNSGMSTAGSGDVLTGIILSLLAQSYEPEDAAVVGVFLHAMAGDLAASYRSQESMIASDIIDMLGKTFKQIR